MSKNPVINALMFPFRLPQMIADKVTPKIDLLASEKSLDRRMMWGEIGGVVFGCVATLGFMAGSGLIVASTALGATAALVPGLAILGGAYVTATMSSVCRKHRIDCLAVKCVNAAVKQMTAEAEAVGMRAVIPAPKAPDFNHVAATTLDKDIKAMPAIKLAANRSVSP